MPLHYGAGHDGWLRAVLGTVPPVLVAQVEVPPSLPANKAVLRPIGTLSGQFDSSRFSDVLGPWLGSARRGSTRLFIRAKGQLVLATICRAYWLPRVDYVVEGQMAFIRIRGSRWKWLTVSPIRKSTRRSRRSGARRHEVPDYWATHRVVFAEVMGVTGPNRAQKRVRRSAASDAHIGRRIGSRQDT